MKPNENGRSFSNAPVHATSLIRLLVRVGFNDDVKHHMYSRQNRWDGSTTPVYHVTSSGRTAWTRD
eukprot:3731452-Prorocentrum_lima.AAC.1